MRPPQHVSISSSTSVTGQRRLHGRSRPLRNSGHQCRSRRQQVHVCHPPRRPAGRCFRHHQLQHPRPLQLRPAAPQTGRGRRRRRQRFRRRRRRRSVPRPAGPHFHGHGGLVGHAASRGKWPFAGAHADVPLPVAPGPCMSRSSRSWVQRSSGGTQSATPLSFLWSPRRQSLPCKDPMNHGQSRPSTGNGSTQRNPKRCKGALAPHLHDLRQILQLLPEESPSGGAFVLQCLATGRWSPPSHARQRHRQGCCPRLPKL
mmetsp:Transcript_99571/g.253074  ORF Transcript_99571/g.253074 Transcript_99571/m.253074 type:complete len:258 (+) Transcript_99571:182-955(+)